MQIAYADEYGDAGYKFDSGSSALFVMTILLPSNPESLLNRIAVARRQLGKSETFEFHFRGANANFRRVFFEAIAGERMEHLVAIVHKTRAPAGLQRRGKVGLYTFTLAGLALQAPMTLHHVKLYVDGTGKQ